jgi:peptidoglycan hydrolase-like protein with peptidoglycan-binding domain
MKYPDGVRQSESTFGETSELGEINRNSIDYVRWLQAALNKALQLRLATDGRIGRQTRKALRTFQQRSGLTPTGNPDLLTERALSRAGAGSPPGVGASPGGAQAASAPSSVPTLINSETTPPAKTLYVNIPLGSENPARPMTGIFIPANYRHSSEVDLILYLHGFKPKSGLTIDRYWNTRFVPHFPLRDRLNDAGKNVVLVAPTLGDRSQSGNLVRPGGLDDYIAKVLAALGAHGGGTKQPRLGKLILACHSGGGWPMRQLALSNNRTTQNIQECWGFDCTYNRGDDTEWARWGRANPQKKLFIYYLANTRTAVLSEKLKRLNVPNVSVLPSPARAHNWVPIQHWRGRIEAAPLQVRSQASITPASPELEFSWGSISDWFRGTFPATPPAPAPSPTPTTMTSPLALAVRMNAVALAVQEWNRWNQGRTKETDARMRTVLEDYWRTGVGYRPNQSNWWSAVPWSAAFISWLMRKAGAGKDFKYSGGHSYYTAAAKDNTIKNNNNMFKAYPIDQVSPRVGDLVCKSRAGSGATYSNIRGGMTTHCDIVTNVRPGELSVIGGNVDNSVSQKRVPIDPAGRIRSPSHFAVIRIGN